jgi:hypothetical protein
MTQYIKLKNEKLFREAPGRYTHLKSDAPGFLLTDENIEKILEPLPPKRKAEYILELEETASDGLYAALVGGYLVPRLNESDFERINEPVMDIIPGKII